MNGKLSRRYHLVAKLLPRPDPDHKDLYLKNRWENGQEGWEWDLDTRVIRGATSVMSRLAVGSQGDEYHQVDKDQAHPDPDCIFPKKNLGDLRHMRVLESVAAFALAGYPKAVIAQGLDGAKHNNPEGLRHGFSRKGNSPLVSPLATFSMFTLR